MQKKRNIKGEQKRGSLHLHLLQRSKTPKQTNKQEEKYKIDKTKEKKQEKEPKGREKERRR